MLLLVLGCTSGEIDSASESSVEAPGVITHPDGSHEIWQITEEYRLGTDADEEPVLFGWIVSFAVDAQGRIYVLDRQADEIQVFDADGTYISTVGSKGAGPGEFEDSNKVDIGPEGEIWVMEMMKGRLSILDSTGRFLRMERVNSTGWDHINYPGGFDRVGRYNAGVLVSYGENMDLQLARYSASFAPVDTVRIPRSPVEFGEFEVTQEGATYVMSIPFQGQFVWRFSPSGNFWTLLTSTYVLSEVSSDGEILRSMTMPFEARSVSDEDLREAHERLQFLIQRGADLDLSRIPDTHPPVKSFFIDDGGHIWVSHNIADDDSEVFDVFSDDGSHMGTVQLPFSLDAEPAPIVLDGYLYGISTNEDGLEELIKARIDKLLVVDAP